MRWDAFLPQALIICMIVLVLADVSAAQDSNEAHRINNTSSEDFDHCKEFLSCENEMMAIHKRCTEQSRKATATACGLNQQFSDLSKLMDGRISEFQGCVDDNGTASNSSTEISPNAFDIPEECLKSSVLRKHPVVHPEMGCWRAVAMVRLHCQRLRKCCPAANVCMKDLRNSEATRSLREKHIEINRKTLECRNRMRQVIMEKRNGTNSNLAVQAHAVLIAQKETPGGKIQQKYLSLLPKDSNRHFNPTLKHPNRTKLGKQIYAAPRAKPYPESNTPITQQSPLNVSNKVLISPPKSKRFESRETIDRTTNQGGHSKDVSVSNRLGEFETILRKMEASSPKGHSKARGVSQSGAVKRKAVRTQTLRHSMRPGPVSKLQRPIWRDVSSDGAKTSIDGGEKIIFQKKWAVPRAVAGQRRRRIIRHFPQQVFPSLTDNEMQDNVVVSAPSQASKSPENPETQLNRAAEDYENDHAPMGIFGPISATTPPGAVPVMVSRTQSQSFALPAYVDLGKLKVFQARPIHKLTQSVSSGKRRTALNRRLMSSGRLNLLGKRVLPLKISNGNGLPYTDKEGRRRKQSAKQRGVVTGRSDKDNRLRKPLSIGSDLNFNGQGLEPISSAAIVNTPEIAMNLGHGGGGWTKVAPVAVPTTQLETATTTMSMPKAIGREPETTHFRSRMRSPAYKTAGFHVGVRRISGESPEKSSKEEKSLVGLDGETGNRENENSETTVSSVGIATTTADSSPMGTPEPVILPAWPSSNIVMPYAKFNAEADLAVEGHVPVVKEVNGISQKTPEESHNIENTEDVKSSFSADPFSTFTPTFNTQASPSIMLDENLLSPDAFTTPSPDTRRTVSLIREWTAASIAEPVDPNLHDHETMIPTPPSFRVEVDSDDTVDSDKQDLETLHSLPFINEIRRSPVSTTKKILENRATVSTTTPQMIVVDGSAEIQDQVGQNSETQTSQQEQSSTPVPVTNRLRQIKIAMAPVTQIPPVTWQDFGSTIDEKSESDLQQSTMQTEVTRKPNKVLDAVLARKQLQRILVPLGSSQSGNRVLGYRNKVLQARRQLSGKLNGTQSTGHIRQMSHENALAVSQRPKAGSLSLRVLKKEPLPQSSGDNVALSPNIDEPSADVESLQRTTVGVNLHFESDPLVTLPPTAEIRRSPARNNLPPPPVSASDPFSDKAVSDSEEELLLVKHNLVLNLEKFLDARKNEARKKLEEESERDRLEVLRKPKSEYDSRHQISGYCELYSTCSDQLKYVQNKCQQFPDESGSAGRLLPGLPKRRFGSCNARLLAIYQRVDVVHLELNENIENCLVEKIAMGAAKISDSCPAEWPTLPLFESDANNCVQRVSIIQTHCKKLGHCCSSLESCRESVDNSGLARRLRLEEERLKQRSAECQVQANDEYKKLRVLQHGTESTDKSSDENRGVENVNKGDESPPSVILSPFTGAFQQNVKTQLDTSNLNIPLQSPVAWPTSEQRRLRRRRDRNSRNRLRL